MKKTLLIFTFAASMILVLAGFTGCDQAGILSGTSGTPPDNNGHPSFNEPGGQTITDYFGGQEVFFYHQYTGEKITAVSGTAPASTGNRFELVNEEFFFNSGSSIDDTTLTVTINRVQNSEYFAGTMTEGWFDWPQSLTITEKSDTMLIAEGQGHGHAEKTSDAESYVYDYVTYEKWILTTERLENYTTVTVTTDAPSLPITAPGWVETNRDYSQYGITVTAYNPYGFRFTPVVKLVRVNGIDDITQGLEWQDTEISATSRRFTFASFYNADYVVIGGCRTLGRNAGILAETWDETEYTVRVTSASKPLPDYYYPEK
jgi:hypothetical protein